MTRGLTTAVWVGYPGSEGRVMDAVPGYGRMFGGTAPAKIWHDFMIGAVKGRNCKDWPKPKTKFVAKTAKPRGGNATPTDPGPGQYYAPGVPPPSQAPAPVPVPPKPPPSGGAGGTAIPPDDGGDYPPDQYEAPPEPTPPDPADPAADAAAAEAVAADPKG